MWHAFFYFVLILGFVTTAQAQEKTSRVYIRGDVGGFTPVNKFKESVESDYISKKPKNGMVYNFGVGYRIDDNWRGDVNLSYRNLKYKASETDKDGDVSAITQKVKIYNLFLNGYYDLNFHKIIKPYLTAGVGYNRSSSSNAVITENELFADELLGTKVNNFIWNIGIGARFILSNRFSLDASYKYVYLGKTKTKNSRTTTTEGMSQKLRSHDIMGGVIVYL